ncbi:serine/threonine protein phosphatase [Eikenella sp. NML96-A-049]|uniref:protein phosphatase 2C domain-containing protein n=1 Tax=unclassified Eikenella TaxID=2639367 RepID=UPI0007DE6B1F|nr:MULTISPECIES: protein phosphatase 2C domain-containing protein [unclassified Eikenella]OAM34024.1 serine/threonine protein phosphatase [Eikenella sp. NML070372]OAM38770.1 serine/threonine protein phosphatase [Eikenella sp. NML96-A-049]
MQINFHQSQYIGQREEQQDALGNLVLSPQHKLYVLADGMGGQRGGQIAAKTVVAAFLDYFQQYGLHEAEQDLRRALHQANQTLSDTLRRQPKLEGMGTTVIAVVVDETDNRYSYISVGDSPLYTYGQGSLRRINANHAFAEDLKRMIAAGEISSEAADRHPARHAVTSAVMGKDIAHIDCSSGTLSPGELLLLASDGVQTLSDEEIEQTLIAASGSLEDKVNTLLALVQAKRHPHQDNTSLLLVQATAKQTSPATQVHDLSTQSLPATGESTLSTRISGSLPPAPSTSSFPAKGLIIGFILGVLLVGTWWFTSDRHTQHMPPNEDVSSASATSSPATSEPYTPTSPTPASEPPSVVSSPKNPPAASVPLPLMPPDSSAPQTR